MKEVVTIQGEDFSKYDAEARQILDHLAQHPTMPLREDLNTPSHRVLVNMILRARDEIEATSLVVDTSKQGIPIHRSRR